MNKRLLVVTILMTVTYARAGTQDRIQRRSELPQLWATAADLARRDFGDAGFDVALEAEEIGFHLRRTLP